MSRRFGGDNQDARGRVLSEQVVRGGKRNNTSAHDDSWADTHPDAMPEEAVRNET